jgi:hypothetical protein
VIDDHDQNLLEMVMPPFRALADDRSGWRLYLPW